MDDVHSNNWTYVNTENIYVCKYAHDKTVPMHKHEFVELVIVGAGACTHVYNGIEIPIIRGDVFTILPNEMHSYKINNEAVVYNCLFYPETIKDELENLKNIDGVYDFLMIEPSFRAQNGKQGILHLNSIEFSYVENIFNHMLEEQTLDISGREIVLKCDLILLLIFLGRAWSKQFSNQVRIFDEKKILLKNIINYIEEHLGDNLNISKIATNNFISSEHLRKLFKDNTGFTPTEYINTLRISKAVTYIKEKDLNFAEIAEIVGIDDQNYFTRLFRKIMGCTPTEYQNKINK